MPSFHSIMANLTVFTDKDPEVAYPNQNVIWKCFEEAFKALWGLVTYAPVFREYYYRGLQEFYSDNVMYLELRVLLPEVRSMTLWSLTGRTCCCSAVLCFVFQLYELDGSSHDKAWTMRTYQEVTRQFKEHHPDFYGTRLIFSVHRWLLHCVGIMLLHLLCCRRISIGI